MRIASYNVENLLERAIALSADVDAAGAAVIAAQSEINQLLRQAVYTDSDRKRILELLTELGLRDDDNGKLAILRQNRGQLVRRPHGGPVEVVARGRAEWLGWVELKREAVNELSTRHTARVIHEVDADILGVIEAENRISLRDFSRVMLRRVGGQPYAHSMLIEGNDDRGINVGIMTKTGFDLDAVRTHIFDLGPNDLPIFSRDCAEYLVRTPGGAQLLVLVNHFKSKRGGGDARRLAQASRVKDIVTERLPEYPHVVVLGDFNDSPDSTTLAPLLEGTLLKDISTSPVFHDGGFPGTFGTQGPITRSTIFCCHPVLWTWSPGVGFFRRGVFSASKRWPMFDTITKKIDQASDHAAIWATINLQ